jgi:hypothetical protein
VLEQKEGTVFQRLREWYLDAAHKRGAHRRDLDVASCFGPLLSWIVARLVGEDKRLALALDATTLGNRWIVLSVSVLVSGCAIPVAWKVVPSHAKGSWRPYWESLLGCLKGRIPPSWQVLVLADRGLYARWLYTAIVACGWHPFLRINLAVKARELAEEHFDWLSRWVSGPGARWKGPVECFARDLESAVLHPVSPVGARLGAPVGGDHRSASFSSTDCLVWLKGLGRGRL